MNNRDIVKKWMEKAFNFSPFEEQREAQKEIPKMGKHQGSKRGARHEHKPVWLPGAPRIRPALYRQRHMGRAKE
jgi:hypothetical protein